MGTFIHALIILDDWPIQRAYSTLSWTCFTITSGAGSLARSVDSEHFSRRASKTAIRVRLVRTSGAVRIADQILHNNLTLIVSPRYEVLPVVRDAKGLGGRGTSHCIRSYQLFEIKVQKTHCISMENSYVLISGPESCHILGRSDKLLGKQSNRGPLDDLNIAIRHHHYHILGGREPSDFLNI